MSSVVPFSLDHVDAATDLVIGRVRQQRSRQPLLPPPLEERSRVGGLLANVAGQGLGVAALEGDRLVGFLAANGIPLWGSPGVYVAEWANHATDPDLIAPLYGAASDRWLAEGRIEHAITLWTDDASGEASWHHIGFGRVMVDTLRDLSSMGISAPVGTRQAGPTDASVVANMERALWEYLAAPPVCRVHRVPEGVDAVFARLEEGRWPVWLALEGGTPVGFLSLSEPDDYPAAFAADDVVRCDGAYLRPAARHRGTGTALLETAIAWAAEAGFKRLAVDYESANPEASRFWPARGCQPVLHSLRRRIAG